MCWLYLTIPSAHRYIRTKKKKNGAAKDPLGKRAILKELWEKETKRQSNFSQKETNLIYYTNEAELKGQEDYTVSK